MELVLVAGGLFAMGLFVLIDRMDAILDRFLPAENPLEQFDPAEDSLDRFDDADDGVDAAEDA